MQTLLFYRSRRHCVKFEYVHVVVRNIFRSVKQVIYTIKKNYFHDSYYHCRKNQYYKINMCKCVEYAVAPNDNSKTKLQILHFSNDYKRRGGMDDSVQNSKHLVLWVILMYYTLRIVHLFYLLIYKYKVKIDCNGIGLHGVIYLKTVNKYYSGIPICFKFPLNQQKV